MKLEDQVCSLESARRLKELGFDQDSLFSYGKYLKQEGYGLDTTDKWNQVAEPFMYAAYTVAELGEMLPDGYYTENNTLGWLGLYALRNINPHLPLFCESDEAEARAKMLIYLKENRLL